MHFNWILNNSIIKSMFIFKMSLNRNILRRWNHHWRRLLRHNYIFQSLIKRRACHLLSSLFSHNLLNHLISSKFWIISLFNKLSSISLKGLISIVINHFAWLNDGIKIFIFIILSLLKIGQKHYVCFSCFYHFTESNYFLYKLFYLIF